MSLSSKAVKEREPKELTSAVSVLCSTCDLDNDYAPIERFHPPWEIREICVKGENEMHLLLLPDHAVTRQETDAAFIEKHERYDVFGR